MERIIMPADSCLAIIAKLIGNIFLIALFDDH